LAVRLSEQSIVLVSALNYPVISFPAKERKKKKEEKKERERERER